MTKTEDIKNKERTDESAAIDSDTFTPTGKRLGLGGYGIVDVYEDISGQKWAIKRFCPGEHGQKQMEKRGWTEEDVMRKEAIPLNAAHRHTVPRLIERDKNGKMFVAMPVYDGDLSKRNYSLEQMLVITRDVVDSLDYLHNDLDRAHGDIKLDNVLISGDRGFVGDFGSATCISSGDDCGSPRGAFGLIHYRAPECFSEDSAPSRAADIWSVGAMVFEKATGERIYDGINDPSKITSQELKSKIKKAPRKLRNLLRGCLNLNRYERFSAEKARDELDRISKKTDYLAAIGKGLKLVGLAAAIALPASFTIYKGMTLTPTELTIPPVVVQGNMQIPGQTEEQIRFVQEDIELPGFEIPKLMTLPEDDFRFATDNRVAACLLRTYWKALTTSRLGFLDKGGYVDPLTDVQHKMWVAYTSDAEKGMGHYYRGGHVMESVAKSLEVALSKSKTPDGRVDLEDTLAIARLGEDVVNQARRASGSFDFGKYIDAKTPDGKSVIPENEQKFLKTWLTYTITDYFDMGGKKQNTLASKEGKK